QDLAQRLEDDLGQGHRHPPVSRSPPPAAVPGPATEVRETERPTAPAEGAGRSRDWSDPEDPTAGHRGPSRVSRRGSRRRGMRGAAAGPPTTSDPPGVAGDQELRDVSGPALGDRPLLLVE